MACCVLMAFVWCAALGGKAWLSGAFRKGDLAQRWRLMAAEEPKDEQP